MKLSDIKLEFRMHINNGRNPHMILRRNEKYGISQWAWAGGFGPNAGKVVYGLDDGDKAIEYTSHKEFLAALCSKFPEIEDDQP